MLPERRIYYPYKLLSKSVIFPFTDEDIKNHLRIDCFEEQKNYIYLLVKATLDQAETYMGIDILIKEYLSYRDNLDLIQLRKTPFNELVSFKYLKDSVFTSVDSNLYKIVLKDDFANFELLEDKTWPDDIDNTSENVEIIFKSGYGEDRNAYPPGLDVALLQHLAFLYENRGDCINVKYAIPLQAKVIYDLYSIKHL